MVNDGHSRGERFADQISGSAGRQIARRPCKLMAACCGLMWGIVATVMLSGQLTFSGEGVKDWDVLDDQYVEDKDAIILAGQDTDCLQAPAECPAVPVRSIKDYRRFGTQIMFRVQGAGGPIFTPERLQRICRVERVFFDSAAYPQFCQLQVGSSNVTDCAPEEGSVARFFYASASMDAAECGLLPAAVVDSVSRELHLGLDDPQQFAISGTFIGSDVYDGKRYTGGLTSRTKSQLGLGYPLEGEASTSRSEYSREVMGRYTDGFYQGFEEGLLEFFGLSHRFMRSAYWEEWTTGDIEVLLRSTGLQQLDTMRTINTDMLIAILSILFVGGFLAWRTRSFFIGAVSLWQIIISVVIGFAVYRFLLQITFFHQLHGLLIFIILGIGADDVFVFSDAWWRSATEVGWQAGGQKEKDVEEAPSEEQELEVLAARIAFAYKHAMVAVMNTSFTTGVAFLATAISPIMPIHSMGIYACLLVLLNYLLTISLTPVAFAVWHTYSSRPWWPHCPHRRCCPRSGCPGQAFGSSPGRRLDILRTGFVPIFKHRALAAAMALLLLGWAVANAIFAVQLEPPRDQFQYFADGHMSTRARTLSRYGYAAATQDAYNTLSITFGVAGVDRSVEPGMDKWKPHEWYGVPVYDPDFDFSRSDSQEFLRGFCQRLRSVACKYQGCQPIGYLVLQSATSVSCFIEDFDAWANGTRYEGAEFTEMLRAFRRETSPASSFVEEASWKNAIGFVDGQLKYVRVRAKMSLITGQGEAVKDPIRELLEDFLASEQAKAPEPMRAILQMVPLDWFWTATTKALIRGLFMGFAICFPVAFLVLLVTTHNLIVSIFAIVTVALIVACVLGYCFLAGWTLGIGESVAGIIVIGLSVDYTIHMGHMYLEAAAQGLANRADRWDYALRTMGATVMAGAATTFFAGLVMQFCQIRFFNLMSTLIVLTIAYSLLFTLCFFMGLMRVLGPENKQGEVSQLFAICRSQEREPWETGAADPRKDKVSQKLEEVEGPPQQPQSG